MVQVIENEAVVVESADIFNTALSLLQLLTAEQLQYIKKTAIGPIQLSLHGRQQTGEPGTNVVHKASAHS